ncbi:hypothetical protein [Halorubellus sp. PRR65]|uniref:hypothetical protein n=1 Tax=Halorubellus sp. PRR65 TaxID=3098148 RepID=UPI002B25C4E1|nr:hypothetical protein [Halorubellus sp. PRR65]
MHDQGRMIVCTTVGTGPGTGLGTQLFPSAGSLLASVLPVGVAVVLSSVLYRSSWLREA